MKSLKLIVLVLLLVFIIPGLGGFSELAAKKKNVIKILSIGNSFSEDAVENYLYELAEASGKEIIIGNLLIGGCTLERHLDNALHDIPAYEYRKIDRKGRYIRDKNKSMKSVLKEEKWDYISFQEASPFSGIVDKYMTFLPSLVEYVKKNVRNKRTVYMLHQTWAYANGCKRDGFQYYDKNQLKMCDAIVDAVWKAADEVNIEMIIPSGTAIQNGRTSFIGDNFCRDGFHLSYDIGRFTVACTWFEKIYGINVINNSYVPQNIDKKRVEVAKRAAHCAVLNPRKITEIR